MESEGGNEEGLNEWVDSNGSLRKSINNCERKYPGQTKVNFVCVCDLSLHFQSSILRPTTHCA